MTDFETRLDNFVLAAAIEVYDITYAVVLCVMIGGIISGV